MKWPAAIRARVSRSSLGRRLVLSFAGVALFTMVVLGAILVPLLGNYYARSEVSRLEAGGLRESLQVVDVVPLIRDMADAIASRAEQSGLEFSLELPSDPVPARIHADGLRTAIDNLVDNALKFTPRGGRVVIGAAATAGGALIWVEETGIGIPPEDMDGLFGRFHRGRNAAAYPGSGLGLAIVQATVELHGGHVRAESRPGRTRLELTLPAV